MQTKIQALCFDLDGTLIDTSGDILLAVNLTLAEFGFMSINLVQCLQFIGDGVTKLMQRALGQAGYQDVHHPLPADLLEKAVAIFRQYYSAHLLDSSRPYPQVITTLHQFQTLPLAVISNKSVSFCKRILDSLHLSHYFKIILGGDSLSSQKPDPLPLRHVLQQFNIAPQHCLMVGDSSNDIRCAHSVGALACAVTYGFRDETELRSCEPDWLIHDFAELVQIVVNSGG